LLFQINEAITFYIYGYTCRSLTAKYTTTIMYMFTTPVVTEP